MDEEPRAEIREYRRLLSISAIKAIDHFRLSTFDYKLPTPDSRLPTYDFENIPNGMHAETIQFGASTVSLTLRSIATEQRISAS